LYVTIKGYTDALGNPDYNLNLSKRRAESVKEFLSSNGIGESRIRTLSFGASHLLEKNKDWKAMSEQELRKYRKVEIIIYLPK
jgi:OOP family OmpA-OmpF porin